jgi:hypothetical protein
MQLTQQDNVTYVTIADNTAAAPTAGDIASSTTIGDGAAAIVDEGSTILDAARYLALGADRQVRLVQNIGGDLFYTADFTKGKLRAGKSNKVTAVTASGPASISVYSAAAQQITMLGYNGTTGALPIANDTSYWIKIRKNDNDAANRSQPASLFSQFKTDATGTQEELAFGLVEVGVKNMSTQAQGTNGYLRFEALCDEASAADGTATTITVEYGSKAGTLNAGATTFAVGDVLRIGGGATTDPVYKIATLSTTAISFDIAYQGASGAGVTIEYITAAAATTGDFGVQLRGVADDFDVNSFRNYYSNRFTGTFSDTSVLNTLDTAARNGSGTWQEAAMAEYMSMGNQGENSMLAVPPTMRTASVITDGEYDVLALTADEDIHGLTSANTETSRAMLYIQDGSGSPSGLAIAVVLGFVAGDLT